MRSESDENNGGWVGRVSRRASAWVEEHFVTTITCVIIASMLAVCVQLNRMSNRLVNNLALRDAAAYIEAIGAFRTLYTSEVVNRLIDENPHFPVRHDYEDHEGAIPLPATLTKMIGDHLGEKGSECNTHLYSDYPFEWRADTGGPLDEFERLAIKALREDPSTPFHRIEMINGEPVVRYATADIMRASCIQCHNTHPQSPKTDWKEGDVRGVLAVTMPLRGVVADTRQGARSTLTVVAVLGSVIVALFAVMLARLRRQHRRYQRSNYELTRKSQALTLATHEIEQANSELKRRADDLNRSRGAALNLMRDMRMARDEAEAAAKTKSQFLANMSHEIRTPLTAILGFAEALQEAVEAKNLDAVNTIQRNGEHLLHVINDILDLSKIEAGRFQVEQLEVSPHQLLVEIEELMQIRADAKGLGWRVRIDGELPIVVRTDPTRLRQILINLVGNAIKFTEIGSVELTARMRKVSGVELLEFDIVDTGIGMTPEQRERIFQPFMQGDESMSRKFGGTGLGLTISKRFAELLGGGIEVDSGPSGGSEFRVTVNPGPLRGIPRHAILECNSAAKEERETGIASRVELGGARVLLVEDGPDNQRLIAFVLEKAGADVTVAENGEVGRDKALHAEEIKEPFDVIVMDMQMPVLDGYAATAELRTAGYDRPIIALTAHAMTGDRQKCLAAGCDDFATKPIDRDTLLNTIARHVRPVAEEQQN